MHTKSIVSGLLILLAAGGVIYVLAGGQKPAAPSVPGTTGDSGQDGRAAAGRLTAAAGSTESDSLPADGVVVYYFHNRQRCYTCNKMETLADAVVSERFADHLDNGRVVFKAVNVQTPEGSHFIEDFQLRSAGVVMVERQRGQDLRWRRLDEVWTKIRNEEEYKAYIAGNLVECLRAVGLEKI